MKCSVKSLAEVEGAFFLMYTYFSFTLNLNHSDQALCKVSADTIPVKTYSSCQA